MAFDAFLKLFLRLVHLKGLFPSVWLQIESNVSSNWRYLHMGCVSETTNSCFILFWGIYPLVNVCKNLFWVFAYEGNCWVIRCLNTKASKNGCTSQVECDIQVIPHLYQHLDLSDFFILAILMSTSVSRCDCNSHFPNDLGGWLS